MSQLRQLLTVTYRYSHPLDRLRAAGLLWATWIAVAVWAFATLVINLPVLLQGGNPGNAVLAITLIAPFPLVLIIFLVERGDLKTASRLFVVTLLITNIPYNYQIDAVRFLLLTIPLVAAGMLLDRPSVLIIAVIITIGLFVGAVSGLQDTGAIPWEDLLLYGLVLVINAALLLIFNVNSGQHLFSEALVDTDQMQEIARFEAELDEAEGEEAVLDHTISLVRGRLRYSYAQVYLADEQGRVTRRVHAGLGVGPVSASEHDLDSGVITEAIRARALLVINPDDSDMRRRHLLPTIRAAIIIPLIHGDRVLGVLDVQSMQHADFTQLQIALLELVASKTAALLVQVRQNTFARQHTREQEAVIQNLRNQVRELRQLSRHDISSAWHTYLEGRGKAALGFDLAAPNLTLELASDMPRALQAAAEAGRPHVEETDDGQVVSVPILLRDQALGAMSFTMPEGRAITEHQLDMMQVVANRLALALETRRLFEQSQAQALRERQASDTANLLISATDVQTVLNLAAENFNEVLGAVRTHIRLKPGLTGAPQADITQEEAES